MVSLILNDETWTVTATLVAVTVALLFVFRSRRQGLSGATGAAALNLFFGSWIAVMGFGHIVAVTTKAILGTVSDPIRLWFLIPFGLALMIPGVRLARQTQGIARHDAHRRRTALRLNVWLSAMLAIPAPPLLVVTFLNIALLFAAGRRSATPAIAR